MNKQENKRVFKFEELAYKDLKGEKIVIPLDSKQLAEGLFNHIDSLEFDLFVRNLYDKGKAEFSDELESKILALLPSIWIYRVNEAIKELFNKAK
ncbi:hypothetical protein ORI89_19095 [Sphingobacterium sp. UT-1RO-CII-1]|uniref:hypothetical protein n=1 Tax=Sphingobacterium sp. UT-1RO-CII-1 TaxID=2995225 RepID=UPI00227A0A1D|nr:hypothetical protein [Sphingobacterium sp. UT-1RO-CII-1]MCY4781761.1 hypothetical protein [Sphingobacterium sp. UT-1RO-CII-1]